VRVAVEWGYGRIVRYFAFLDFKKNLKVFLQPVAVYYAVGALLTNCHTCLYGSQTSRYFGIAPPSLEEYLLCTLTRGTQTKQDCQWHASRSGMDTNRVTALWCLCPWLNGARYYE
jgi:hypothetical protein